MAVRTHKHQRRFRNYLLQPFLQVKIGLYTIFLSIAFVGALLSIISYRLGDLFTLLLEMSDVKAEVLQAFNKLMQGILIEIGLSAIVYLILTIATSIFLTHRLVGPTIAFRRQIQLLKDHKFDSRVTLRAGDAFSEVADALNNLAEHLESENRQK